MLATMHNVQHYLDTMREMREAILFGRFPAYLRNSRTHLPAEAAAD